MAHQRTYLPLAGALLLALSQIAAATAADTDDLARAQVRLENLRYTLIDLDPDDGITPSLRFEQQIWQDPDLPDLQYTSANTFVYYEDGDAYVEDMVSGTFFDTAAFARSNADGTVHLSRSSTSAETTASVKVGDLSKLNSTGWMPSNAPEGATWHHTIASLFNDYSGTNESVREARWYLSPRTAVLIEGVAVADATIDLSHLNEVHQTGQVTGKVSGDMAVYVRPELTAAGMTTAPSMRWRSRFDLAQTWTEGAVDQSAPQRSLTEAMSLRIDNPAALIMRGGLFFEVSASASLLASPVPETSTTLMMGLGVGALAWQIRRRKAGRQP